MNYLASFKPLVAKALGRKAVLTFGIPPFVDGSCRREPDFESRFPSISALCRFTKFAPRLQVGDTVVYITHKGRYFQTKSHWRLVGILKVLERFESHAAAAQWYKERSIPLPSNCIVSENPPLPLEKTIGAMDSIRRWDGIYQLRTRKCGVFLVCESKFVELHNPPILGDEAMIDVFGRIPGTRNPGRISDAELAKLKSMMHIAIKESE